MGQWRAPNRRERATDATTRTPDFEPRRPVGSFLTATRAIFLSPARFFAAIRKDGSPSEPVFYAAACLWFYILLSLFYPLAVDAARDARLPEASALVPTGLTGTLLSVVFFFVVMPLTALLGIYVSAALYQLLVRLIVGRENGGYDATVRVVAYLSALALLLWVPVLWVPVGLWGVWVGAMGFREVHSTTTARAVLVAGIPYVLWTAWWVFSVVTGEATLADVLLAY